MVVLSLSRPPEPAGRMRGRRAASYRPRMIVTGISGNARFGLFGQDLLDLPVFPEIGEAGPRPGPGFARRGRQADATLRGAERRQGRRLPAPVTASPVAGQRLLQAAQRLRVPAQRQIATAQLVQGIARTVDVVDLGEGIAGLLQVADGLDGPVEIEKGRSEVDQGDAFAVAVDLA